MEKGHAEDRGPESSCVSRSSRGETAKKDQWEAPGRWEKEPGSRVWPWELSPAEWIRERMEVRKWSVRTDSFEDPAWTCGCWWSWGQGTWASVGLTPAWCWRKGLEERPGCDPRTVGFLLVLLGLHEDCVSGPGAFVERV